MDKDDVFLGYIISLIVLVIIGGVLFSVRAMGSNTYKLTEIKTEHKSYELFYDAAVDKIIVTEGFMRNVYTYEYLDSHENSKLPTEEAINKIIKEIELRENKINLLKNLDYNK